VEMEVLGNGWREVIDIHEGTEVMSESPRYAGPDRARPVGDQYARRRPDAP
jgi:hypothetical protein